MLLFFFFLKEKPYDNYVSNPENKKLTIFLKTDSASFSSPFLFSYCFEIMSPHISLADPSGLLASVFQVPGLQKNTIMPSYGFNFQIFKLYAPGILSRCWADQSKGAMMLFILCK